MIKPRTMPGVLELLPLEQVAFQRMLDSIRRGYERFGYVPIETPVLELAEVLLTKTGGETERQVYFAQSTGSREQGTEPDLALRFDLTVPLARYVAEHENQLSFPFRRYQIQRVYRGESAQRGRFREFYQCDIDVIGRDELGLGFDAEMPAVIEQVFGELAIGPFTIRINNRKLMRGLLERAGVTDHVGVLREIDKLEKRGVAGVAATLRAGGLSSVQVDLLLEGVSGGPLRHDEAIRRLVDMETPNTDLETGRGELIEVLEGVASLGVPTERYALDLSVARGLDYYTGTVYETTLDEHPDIGSICSGGRYDDLAGHYTTSRLPGVGLSIGLTRLFWQLREAGLIDAGSSSVRVLVTVMDDDGVGYSLDIATRLRRAGVNTQTVSAPDRLGRQLKYADRSGIRFAIIAGEEERRRGTVTVRDLRSKSQVEMAAEDVAAHLASQE